MLSFHFSRRAGRGSSYATASIARYSTSSDTPNCIGVVKEVYSKWERRAPFTPAHVQHLVHDKGIQVLVEPSLKRVFTDAEYERAGAKITPDLSAASVIFGVKQVPEENLLADKTYVFFSHTIKAQEENMKLLDEILSKNIRLVDYECITVDGRRTSPRLVAFGGHAGRAGMVDALRGLGERLLDFGVSNPFLNVGSSYMYDSYDAACDAVERAGRKISAGALQGVEHAPESRNLLPLTFAFTGNGNVSKGAQEVFNLLPHEMVSPADLPAIVGGDFDPRKVYGCVVSENFLAERNQEPGAFERNEYYEFPDRYRPMFHELVAPYTSVLINGMYWDSRFPRLLTKEQLCNLHESNRERMLMVADITCDIGGSVEFLHRSTPIESPFFRVSKKTGEELEAEMELETSPDETLLMLGVDILPSELAREATSHFGDCMVPLVKDLLSSNASDSLEKQKSQLPEELYGAVIASGGELAPSYEYIAKMRTQRGREHGQRLTKAEARALEGSTVLQCQGHMFDTGLINLILDAIEASNGRFSVLETIVRPNPTADLAITSSIMVQVTMDDGREALDSLIDSLGAIAASIPDARATIGEAPEEYCSGKYDATLRDSLDGSGEITPKRTEYRRVHAKDNASMSFGKAGAGAPHAHLGSRERKRVTLLGAGMVAGPAVEMLSRDRACHVVVVSSLAGEAQQLLRSAAPGRPNVEAVQHDVGADLEGVAATIAASDVVISLLPQTMHARVARKCIEEGVPLVTASYVSPQMKALHQEAESSGVPILCEMGLDPGMDHMSAMKVIHEVQSEGSTVKAFSSICGGLPAPEAANNPLGYKFSWSPRGVLMALQNSAMFLEDGNVVEVTNDKLLDFARPVDLGLPAFSLEQLPNRNSLPYAELYGISTAESVFRGTLRYKGFSKQMQEMKKVGLFDETQQDFSELNTWDKLSASLGIDASSDVLSRDTYKCLRWLGMLDSKLPVQGDTVIDAFCHQLESKLAYGPQERDMALMQHHFDIVRADGQREIRTSTLLAYGEPGGNTAMASTVGLTAAVGAKLILSEEGGPKSGGVFIPTSPEVYLPGLKMLEKEGYVFQEEVLEV